MNALVAESFQGTLARRFTLGRTWDSGFSFPYHCHNKCDYTFSGLKQICTPVVSGGQNSKVGLTGLVPELQGRVQVPAISASRGHPSASAHGPLLALQSRHVLGSRLLKAPSLVLLLHFFPVFTRTLVRLALWRSG